MTYNVFGGTLNPAQSNPEKAILLPFSFTVFGFACSFLATGASLMHSLLSDDFRLLFDLDTEELSDGGVLLVAFLAAS